MLRFAAEGRSLSITTEQLGVPTNANDLAKGILKVINANSKEFGTYHFCNTGSATWYDFAKAIFVHTGQENSVKLAKTDHYRTFAKRPAYSILDVSRFRETFQMEIPEWEESLKGLVEKTKKVN